MSKIAVIGVNESVGREILAYLADDGWKSENIVALEPRAPLGTMVSFGEEEDIDVISLDEFDFSGVDLAVFAGSEEVSKRYINKALSKNVKVIDCTSLYFADSDVPMIVAGVNDAALSQAKTATISNMAPKVCDFMVAICSSLSC